MLHSNFFIFVIWIYLTESKSYRDGWWCVFFYLWGTLLVISFVASLAIRFYTFVRDDELNGRPLSGWLQEGVDIFAIVVIQFPLFLIVSNFSINFLFACLGSRNCDYVMGKVRVSGEEASLQ